MATHATPAKATKAPAKVATKPAVKAAAKPAAAATKAAAAAPKAAPVKAARGAKTAAAAVAHGAEHEHEHVHENGAEVAEKRTRQQLTVVLAINISQARCATHLKQNLGDEQTEKLIKEYRKALKVAKVAQDEAEQAKLKGKIAELSRTMVRISSETPIAVAVVMDSMVKELIRQGMVQATAADRKIVEVSHLHSGEVASMLYYPLFNKLPTFANYDPDHEEELRKERAAHNKAAKEAREAKKAPAEDKKGTKSAKAAAAEDAAEEEEDEDGQRTKTTFYTYVDNALKAVKKEEPYTAMRVSNRVRDYLSEVITEGISRLANLSRIIVQNVMNVRTMNADHIKAVVHMLMADHGRTEEQMAEVNQKIDEKLGVYHKHLVSEKEKKALALNVDKKNELEFKKQEADLIRKKKRTELARKRALEASNKAIELEAETATLEPKVNAIRHDVEEKAKIKALAEEKRKAELNAAAQIAKEATSAAAAEAALELIDSFAADESDAATPAAAGATVPAAIAAVPAAIAAVPAAIAAATPVIATPIVAAAPVVV
jgi:hypothetical protein